MNINPANSAASSHIVDVTVQNFMHEVVQGSLQKPIIVYFTASWCTPCKQFRPLLEKVVNDANGRVKLARIDIDESPQLAQQFRIQSVPMVYIFINGQPVDGFSGVMQESQLKQIFAQFVAPTPQEEDAKVMLLSATELLESGNAEHALRLYQAVAEHDKNNIEAIAGMASAFILLGKPEKAEELLLTIPEASANHEAVLSAKAKLSLAQSSPKPGALEKLRATVKKNPKDNQARFDLANALFAAGEKGEAIDELLNIIAQDKNWNEGAAHQKLLTIFEALGFDHPLSVQGRRKLSGVLFR
jgi:putative thioredoxin